MTSSWVYATSPVGTVHLLHGDYSLRTEQPRTLCGRRLDDEWVDGDDTNNGHSATCLICSRQIGRITSPRVPLSDIERAAVIVALERSTATPIPADPDEGSILRAMDRALAKLKDGSPL